jgi:hypothetical protein
MADDARAIVWPPHYPPDCPPADSTPAAGTVYRAVQGPAISERDFLSLAELRPDRRWGGALCQAHGLSVYRNRSDVLAAIAKSPRLRGYIVATGELQPRDGRTKPTPRDGDSHTTWWWAEGTDFERLFSVSE